MKKSKISITALNIVAFLTILLLGLPVPLSAQDTTPPEVVNVVPADGTADVPVSIERVRIEFSEPMDRATYSGNIHVEDSSGQGYGGCAYRGESVYEKVFCGGVLEPNTTYTVRVSTEVTDIAGNHLAEEFVSSFKTIQTERDTDGDGIPDDKDDCPDSNLSETVIIDDCDSGVQNALFDDGCTISDLISQYAVDANNHGEFVSSVSHTTNSLKKEGIIGGREKGKIQRCAGKADIP